MASAWERKVRDMVGKEDKDQFTQSPVGLVQSFGLCLEGDVWPLESFWRQSGDVSSGLKDRRIKGGGSKLRRRAGRLLQSS